jgi:hypothetical protein
MSNLDIKEAAARAKCHPDTLRKLAADLSNPDRPPGVKIGRPWVFPEELFQKWIDNQCLSINVQDHPSGGSALAAKLAVRRAQRIGKRQKSSRKSSRRDYGASASSATVLPFRGMRQPNGG